MRKPSLSPSKITTYLACPVKYRWTYVDSRGRFYLRAKSVYSFGTTLHRVLERFHDSNDAGVTTTEQAVAALEEGWIEAGYSSHQEMQEALGEGKAIVEAYMEEVRFAPTTAKTLYVEKALTLDMGTWNLIGRVDRVDEHEDGTLEVVDYKTGRSEVSEDDVRHDLSMACYQLMLRAMHPDRQVVASIVALRSGQKATATLTDEEAAEFRHDLDFIGPEILNREYDMITPTRKSLCEHCDFIPLCRRHEEFGD